jgi:sugar lactone lactonase YvrE
MAVVTPSSRQEPDVASGWRLRSASRPRRLPGANGLRWGSDGLLYNASAYGSTLSRLNVDTGDLEVLSSQHPDESVTPDDLAFDSNGGLFLTECMDARVVAFENGRPRVVQDGLSGVNGIAIFDDRIFVDQFLPSGRVLEIFRDEREPILLADGLPGPNGMCVGPDRWIYFAMVFTGELGRVPVDGGPTEVFVGGLAHPGSVRCGPDGLLYVSEGGNGQITRIDPRTREATVVAVCPPGIDNLDLDPSGRIFVSYYIDGLIIEVTRDGGWRELVAPGLMAGYGLACLGDVLHIADGLGAARLDPAGEVVRMGKFTDPGFPGYVRGFAAGADGRLLATTSEGRLARYAPEAVESELIVDGLEEPSGLAVIEGGGTAVVESSAGRVSAIRNDGSRAVIAEGLERPVDVEAPGDGSLYVSDEVTGEVVRISSDGTVSTFATGLTHPQGLTSAGANLFVVDVGSKELLRAPLTGGDPEVIARGLPVGVDGGGLRKTLNGLPEMIPGPVAEFAGLAADRFGRVYVAGDATGSILVFEASA